MAQEANDYKELVQLAYDSVKDLVATDEYKIAGYQIILKSLVIAPNSTPTINKQTQSQVTPAMMSASVPVADWQTQIATRIDIEAAQVGEIYHRTDDGMIELIIEAKDLPSTNSKSTVDIAALLSAGRQAVGIERVTSFDEVRKSAEHYRVYDRKNFARSVRLLGSKFRIDGSVSPATIELTNGAYKIVGEIAHKYVENK